MKDILVLTRILYKNALNKNKEKGSKSEILKKLLVLFAICYIGFVVSFFCYKLISVLKDVNQEQVFLSLLLLLLVVLTIFRTILTSLNVLYFSKDIEFLLPLPVKPIKIVLSKINIMLISSYIMELFVFAIPIIVYAKLIEVSLIFYIYATLIFLFVPIIPMLITTILTVLIMTCTNIFRNKDLVQYITVALSLGLIIFLQIMLSSSSDITNFVIINKMAEINGLANAVGEYFIIFKQANLVITEYTSSYAVKNLIFLIIESIVAYIVVGMAISKVYIRTATNLVTGTNGDSKIKIDRITKRNIGISYVKKEFKLLFRNPIYFMQCVVPIIIFPLLVAMPFLISSDKTSTNRLKMMESIIIDTIQTPIGFGAVVLIICFMYLFNYISVTAISRDGENAIFMKYIPIPLNKQCRYKILPNFILNIFPTVYVLGIIKYLFSGMDNILIVEISIVSIFVNLLISYLSIIIDVLKPKLHWTTEYSVVKQNINMLYSSILIFFIMMGILGICAFFESIPIIVGLISVISIATVIFVDSFVKQYSVQIFKKVA